MINELFAALVIGLVSSAHCLGMCGGIAALLSSTTAERRQLPLVVSLYNLGRLTSYTLMGALLGTLVYSLNDLAQLNSLLTALRVFSGILLIMLGLYIARAWFGIQKIESLGRYLWRFIAPVANRLIPLKNPFYALPLGFLWGWLPCGLVYSMLTWSMASGNGWQGGLIMLAFGIGTLPSMVMTAMSSGMLKRLAIPFYIRAFAGIMITLYGVYVVGDSVTML
jgi:sulfite exporter TauE/SafE